MKKVQTPVHPCFDCCQTVFQKKSHNNYCLAPTLPHEHKRGSYLLHVERGPMTKTDNYLKTLLRNPN